MTFKHSKQENQNKYKTCENSSIGLHFYKSHQGLAEEKTAGVSFYFYIQSVTI